MIYIFNEVLNRISSTIKNTSSKIYGWRKAIEVTVICGAALISIVFSFVFAGTTLALKVDYDGKIIATVKDEKEFNAAVSLVAKEVNCVDVSSVVKEPNYSKTLVLDNDIDDCTTVAQAIIENTDSIVKTSMLNINEKTVACVQYKSLDKLIEERRNAYKPDGVEYTSEFVDKVVVGSGYCLSSELTSIEDAAKIIENLQVRTIMTVTSDKAIPFSTHTQNNSKQSRGYKKIITAGVNGTERVTETITLINDNEIERVLNESVVIANPVTEVVEVGTARSVASSKDKNLAKNSGFLFPLPRSGWTVSAYYGDGRNHQAVDIATKKGTSIFAVKAGTVVSAGWDGNYGKSIVIDHGNGIKTRYAHEDEIFVKVGDVVGAGEVIGTVGRTGNASGNHLHFEVIINGKRVNPAPYINLA